MKTTIDTTPLLDALEALKKLEADRIELEKMQAELNTEEPDLVKRVAGGDIPAAAQLTVNRCKLQIIPNELAQLETKLPQLVQALWDAAGSTMQTATDTAQAMVAAKVAEIDAAVNPVLLPLLPSGTVVSVGVQVVQHTPVNGRAQSFINELTILHNDYPLSAVRAGFGKSKPDQERALEAFRLTAIKKANRCLAAIAKFEKASAA